jgi:4-hydroxybenzoyl-CoA thioesterase
MLHRLIEDWFSEAPGVPLGVMHSDRKPGVPTANLQVEFKKPSRIEDVLEWSLEVSRLGTKSVTLGVSASCGGRNEFPSK